MNTNTETTNSKEHFNDVKITDASVEPGASVAATLSVTSDEQLTEIDADENEERIDNDVSFTSDEEDNIFDDVVEEDTLGYYDSDNDLQIVGETRDT